MAGRPSGCILISNALGSWTVLINGKVHPTTGHGVSVEVYFNSFFNIRARKWWVGNATLQPLYPRKRHPLPIVQEAGWAGLDGGLALSCKCDAASPQNEESKDCAVKLMFNSFASPYSANNTNGQGQREAITKILASVDSVSSFKIMMLMLSSLNMPPLPKDTSVIVAAHFALNCKCHAASLQMRTARIVLLS